MSLRVDHNRLRRLVSSTLAGFLLVSSLVTTSVLPTQRVGASVEFDALEGVTQISNNCAITDGEAFCWGDNSLGQVGNGTNKNSSVPVAVDMSGILNGKTVTQISRGSTHTCAIANGQAYCWGYNAYGQLGNGTNENSSVPVAVDTSGVLNGKTVTQISVGDWFSCAIADGKVYCWGNNSAYQLGDGTNSASNVPVESGKVFGVLTGKTITQLATGSSATCVIADGDAYCWGVAVLNSEGNGSDYSFTPILIDYEGVLEGKTITRIGLDFLRFCVIADGEAYCMGRNSYGQLGNGTNVPTNVFTAVDTSGVLNNKTVTDISVGEFHTCAVADGAAYCWGINSLGNETQNSSYVPVAVDTSRLLNNKTVTQISANLSVPCVLAEDKLYCWGSNIWGELGSDLREDDSSTTPVPVVFSRTPIPEITSLSTNVATTHTSGKFIGIQGSDFDDATVTFNGHAVTVTSQSETIIIAEIPLSVNSGPVDITVTNGNGRSVTLQDGLMYIMREVTGVSFGEDEETGKKIMTVTGANLVGAADPNEYAGALSPPYPSFVYLNGEPLDWCTDGTPYTQAQLEGFGIFNASDTPLCYYLIDSIGAVISPTTARVWLPDEFHITAPGTVSVVGSPSFAFNQTGDDDEDDDDDNNNDDDDSEENNGGNNGGNNNSGKPKPKPTSSHSSTNSNSPDGELIAYEQTEDSETTTDTSEQDKTDDDEEEDASYYAPNGNQNQASNSHQDKDIPKKDKGLDPELIKIAAIATGGVVVLGAISWIWFAFIRP